NQNFALHSEDLQCYVKINFVKKREQHNNSMASNQSGCQAVRLDDEKSKVDEGKKVDTVNLLIVANEVASRFKSPLHDDEKHKDSSLGEIRRTNNRPEERQRSILAELRKRHSLECFHITEAT